LEGKVVAGRYQTIRTIGEGGFGAVFEAVHVVSKKHVALKLLHAHVAKDESSRKRFLREASAPAQIGHEGIVEVYDAGFDEDGSPFVAMELLKGSTLADRMKAGPISLPEFFSIFVRLLDPLAAAHAKNIVHRDLKPENVFLQRKPNGTELLKLLDFGIARDLDASQQNMTQTGMAMGTPHYMAPEQAMSAKGVIASADVWAIGAMMYEILAGRVPFDGETASAVVVRMCTMPHQPMNEAAPQTPMQLAALVDRCLSKEPTARPREAGELLAAIQQLAHSLGIAIPEAIGIGEGGGVSRPSQLGSQPVFNAMPPPTQVPFVAPSGHTGQQSGYGATPQPHQGGYGATPQHQGGYGATPQHQGYGATPQPHQGYGTTPQPQPGFVPPGGFQTNGGGSMPTGQGWNAGAVPMPPPAAKSKTPLIIGGLVGGLLVCGLCGGGLYSMLGDDDTVASIGAQPTPPAVAPTPPVAPPTAPPAQTGALQTFTGSLQQGDRTLQSGEWEDSFELPFQVGQRFRVRLVSDKFDTYLIVRSPSGKSHDNDDASQNDRNAQLELDADEAGAWRVIATSFAAGQGGDYTLTVETLR